MVPPSATKPMQLKLTHRNHRPSSSITALIEAELAALEPDLRIDEARVAIERSLTESPPFRVSLHLVTPGPDIIVRVKDHTLRAAAAKAFERVREKVGQKRAKQTHNRSQAHVTSLPRRLNPTRPGR